MRWHYIRMPWKIRPTNLRLSFRSRVRSEHFIKTFNENILTSVLSTRWTLIREQKNWSRLQSSTIIHFRYDKIVGYKLTFSLQEKVHYCWLFYRFVWTWSTLPDLSFFTKRDTLTYIIWVIFLTWFESVFGRCDWFIIGD